MNASGEDRRSLDLICTLLQLNLKLFQDLFRYKHAFNSFQADLNTHLTTIANHQQQLLATANNGELGNDDELNGERRSAQQQLQRTKQKISDMICKKFLQTCSDLSQPCMMAIDTEAPDDDGYESSIYSILAIVDDFNHRHQKEDEDEDCTDLDNNDSELKCLSKQIGSFLVKMNQDQQFRIKLQDQLFEKLVMGAAADAADGYEAAPASSAANLGPYQCKFCRKPFGQISMLVQHLRERHDSKLACARCDQTFKSAYVLNVHLRKSCCSGPPAVNRHHRFRCQHCPFESDEYGRLVEHLARQHPQSAPAPPAEPSGVVAAAEVQADPSLQERKHLCQWPGCGKTFTRSSYLSNHMMIHSEERNFACDWPGCLKRYKTQAHLLNHILIHKKAPLKDCPWKSCGQKFEQEPQLFEHFQKVHQGKPPPPVAQVHLLVATAAAAPNTTAQPGSAQPTADEQQPDRLSFRCDYCGTCFTKRSSLSNHIKSHSGQYTCSWNGCTFRGNSSVALSRHMLSHKEYVMPILAAAANTAPVPVSKPETYVCKLCGKRFNKRASIINHIRSHSGQYSCQFPGCHFASQSKMLYRRHVLAQNHRLEPDRSGEDGTEQLPEDTSFDDEDEDDDDDQEDGAGAAEEDDDNDDDSDGGGGDHGDDDRPEDDHQEKPETTEEENPQPAPAEVNGESVVRVFRCRYQNCLYQTSKRPLFRVHMLKHSELRKHNCRWPNCTKSFKTKSALNRHLLRHRKQFSHHHAKYKATEEEQAAAPAGQEPKSSSSNSSGGKIAVFKCNHCLLSFRTKSALSNHRISHRKPQYRCQYPGCFYETFRLIILQRHEQETHGKQPEQQVIYRCPKRHCQECFNNWNDLHRHLVKHKNETAARFMNLGGEPSDRQYGCTGANCWQTFPSKRALLNHHMTTHQGEQQPQPQQSADKTETAKTSLLLKQLLVEGRRPGLADTGSTQPPPQQPEPESTDL